MDRAGLIHGLYQVSPALDKLIIGAMAKLCKHCHKIRWWGFGFSKTFNRQTRQTELDVCTSPFVLRVFIADCTQEIWNHICSKEFVIFCIMNSFLRVHMKMQQYWFVLICARACMRKCNNCYSYTFACF